MWYAHIRHISEHVTKIRIFSKNCLFSPAKFGALKNCCMVCEQQKKYIESELMNTCKNFYIIIIDSQTVEENLVLLIPLGGMGKIG